MDDSHLHKFLLQPQETLDFEIKSWLNLDDIKDITILIKSIIALSNHGGGYVLVGYKAKDEMNFEPTTTDEGVTSKYTTDNLNSIVGKYLEPAIHCTVILINHPENKTNIYPVIKVPAGSVPIRAKKGGHNNELDGKYYIRRAGPKSETPQTAHEWDNLITRCVRTNKETLLDDFRKLIHSSNSITEISTVDSFDNWIKSCQNDWQSKNKKIDDNFPGKIKFGYWSFAYRLIDSIKEEDFSGLIDKLKLASRGPNHDLLWVPTRAELIPKPINENELLCWLGDPSTAFLPSPKNSDYWKATLDGKVFFLSGFIEDSREGITPGTLFDVAYPIRDVAKSLLHAGAILKLFNHEGQIEFFFLWSGLLDRVLARKDEPFEDGFVCKAQEYRKKIQLNANEISTLLPEITLKILYPLYEFFSFFKLSSQLVLEQIGKIKT